MSKARVAITKADMLKTALSVAKDHNGKTIDGALITFERRTGVSSLSDKWFRLEWSIEHADFSVWCSRLQHPDGRIRLNSTEASGADAYAGWLVKHFPEIARRVDRLGEQAVSKLHIKTAQETASL